MSNLVKKQAKFTQDVAKLIQYIDAQGEHCTLAEAYRVPEIAALYAKEGRGIKNSLHTQRLAIDILLFSSDFVWLTNKKSYEKYGTFWKSLDKANKWGGDYVKLVDCVHFEQDPSF